jgi:hypothetical protein
MQAARIAFGSYAIEQIKVQPQNKLSLKFSQLIYKFGS